MKNYEIQIIIGANLSYLDSSGISSIFRLVAEYDLFKPKNFIQNLIDADFCKNLAQFFFNFSRQEHHIELARVWIKS